VRHPRGPSGDKVFGDLSNHKPFVSDARFSKKRLSGRASSYRLSTINYQLLEVETCSASKT